MQPQLRIFLLSGSTEYRSADTFPSLVRSLETAGHACTLALAEEKGRTFPHLDLLPDHDVLVVFCKRMELEPGALESVRSWCRAGRPVVGIRCASHAFQNWLEFDREILGGDYQGHGPEIPTAFAVTAPAHPIMTGLAGWTRPDKLYRNPAIDPDATVLMRGTNAQESHPVAWCRTVPQTGGRSFSTSLGWPSDFARPEFPGMLERAIRWTAQAGFHGGYRVAQLDSIDAVACPCGWSRRAFVAPDNPVATLHMVDITEDARVHYHKKLTEIYVVLEGEGFMELNGSQVPVKPLSAIFIEPGCRHRAVGRLRIVNIPIPAFDPEDEWFD